MKPKVRIFFVLLGVTEISPVPCEQYVCSLWAGFQIEKIKVSAYIYCKISSYS